MILKQYYLGCLAHASYLLGDEATSTAIIVDPQRDIHQYLVDAGKFGLEIRHVFLTHFHADLLGIWSCATAAALPSVLVPAQRRNTHLCR
jgi:glyoxylase-like metal-dependent hydrolase (beta-lactamase superfamily II)